MDKRPSTTNDSEDSTSLVDDKSEPKLESYGPALPPRADKTGPSTYGPQIPDNLRKQLENQAENNVNEENIAEEESDDASDVYGPMLPGLEKTSAHIALEERALKMKLKQLDPEESKNEREEWMVELPSVGVEKIGLGSRQFRRAAGPDMSDRSSWTNVGDKPSTKIKSSHKQLKDEMENSELKKRDRKQEDVLKKHKRSSESLLEIHQKKSKNDKDKSHQERTPFNRDTDLQINKFDDAQKASILKRAQLLDDRFSQGKSKFL